MILVTGAAGFIGSAYVWQLNQRGITDILLCDTWGKEEKWKNLQHLTFTDFIFPSQIQDFIAQNKIKLKGIVHMGACSATTEQDMDFLHTNNYVFSKELWQLAIAHKAKYIYASSAATYGDGEKGFKDVEKKIKDLRPLNKYGYSKQLFDLWALKQTKRPPAFAGLKFFNVFGPNEYHKGSMASVVYHAHHQFEKEGKVKLFKSHKEGYKDGEQLRDFVYIKDVVKMMDWYMTHSFKSGIYNVGTGQANSFKDFVTGVFDAFNLPAKIKYIPMPERLRGRYQYFTEASMEKSRKGGIKIKITPLKEAVKDYVLGYLATSDPYLK